MRALHGLLSQIAQGWLDDPTALVHEEEDGAWTLERDGEPTLLLGRSEGDARHALRALQKCVDALKLRVSVSQFLDAANPKPLRGDPTTTTETDP